MAGCRGEGPIAEAAPASKIITILATSEIRGTPEPCGCASDPLGDVARVARLLDDAKQKGGALLVDAGGLRYSDEPLTQAAQAQAELKAEFLEKTWRDLGAVVGVGDEDLLNAFLPFQKGGRIGSFTNPAAAQIAHHVVRDVGGVKIGIFAALDPHSDRTCGGKCPWLDAEEPLAVAKREVPLLRAEGAQLVIALLHVSRAQARRIAQQVPGIGIAVAGDEVGDGGEAEQVGETIVVQPADQAQKVARIELHVVGGTVSTQLIESASQRAARLDKTVKKLAEAETDLAKLTADPNAEAAFVKTKREQVAALTAERDKLRAPAAAATGSWAQAELVPVRRKIARDPQIEAAMKGLDAQVGEANRKAGEKTPVPPADKGEAHYVGMSDCELCHAKANELWGKTVHAHAWQTLVDVNKQWSFDCTKCHVTGYGQPGGSAMAHVDGLQNVQCEVCHGPGSKHVDAPKKVKLAIPTESDCKRCHTKEHSDTFQFDAYLRDVLGPGHGEKRRAALGNGPTGHELRSAAMKEASAK
jgi:hypothetical protein